MPPTDSADDLDFCVPEIRSFFLWQIRIDPKKSSRSNSSVFCSRRQAGHGSSCDTARQKIGKGKKIADELLRASTSVGANYEEAQGAESKADFNHKLQIALKEMRESRYWLCLISEATLLRQSASTTAPLDRISFAFALPFAICLLLFAFCLVFPRFQIAQLCRLALMGSQRLH
jgi:four helix bundle protein